MRQSLKPLTPSRTRWHARQVEGFEVDRHAAGNATRAELTKLAASSIGLVDIGALAKLSKLEYLELAHNEIEDISALADKPKLETIYLASNPIEDISALASCASLVSLSLRDTHVRDLSPIAKLPKLERLVVAGCERLDKKSASILAGLRKRKVEVVTD